jgi:hypothetical protein
LVFIQNVIENVKQNQDQNLPHLILTFQCSLNIRTAIRIQQIVDHDVSGSKQLQVQIKSVNENTQDYIEVLPQIEQEAHPILYRYISMRAKQQTK